MKLEWHRENVIPVTARVEEAPTDPRSAFYREGSRSLQERFGTRRLADRIE